MFEILDLQPQKQATPFITLVLNSDVKITTNLTSWNENARRPINKSRSINFHKPLNAAPIRKYINFTLATFIYYK